ncbi:MAG: aspartate carbamoyltransferase regulatory subunit [Actinomycetaceae bacterium]|nr:aspartate carbamoyltransferase regulatory subunit [Arcanobacterium sp.]MDD7686817.1 aspartate carbamoyltransferase regulatory subunit [Actinomycetaceae bacterium]MDY5273600.1 aspartate carbamoyltransferase regulatory subunit [Arcanobacterium sp.]
MNIDEIYNGVVIDHIRAGRGMRLYELLKLGELSASVAIIQRVQSAKMGTKDIIKIDADMPVDLDVIAYVDPGATVNIIHAGQLVEKRVLSLPQRLVDVIKCKNPRCITTTEQELPHIFALADSGSAAQAGAEAAPVYRCLYCETKADLIH